MQTLLERIARGDHSAVAECVDQYGPFVHGLARRYLSFATMHVDDAVQEIFVEVWTTAGRFDPERGSEAAFIATLARRRLIDAQRRHGAQRRHVTAVGEDRKQEASQRGSDDRDGAHSRDRRSGEEVDAALEALGEIPPDERHALRLHLHDGLTHRQIGEVTDVPVGTVKSRLRRGLMRLRESLRSVTIDAAGRDARRTGSDTQGEDAS